MAQHDSRLAGRLLAAAAAVPIRVRYLLAGLTMGGTWAFLNTPLPQRALSMSLLFLVAPPVLHVLRAHLTRGQDRSLQPRASLTRFFGAKAVLVALALTGTWLLQPITPQAPLLIGAALVATVGVLGPLLHSRMLVRPSSAALVVT